MTGRSAFKRINSFASGCKMCKKSKITPLLLCYKKYLPWEVSHFSSHLGEKTSAGCALFSRSFSSSCCLPSLRGLKQENSILGGDTDAINFAEDARAPGVTCGMSRLVAGVPGVTASVTLESPRLGPVGGWGGRIGQDRKSVPIPVNLPACLVHA